MRRTTIFLIAAPLLASIPACKGRPPESASKAQSSPGGAFSCPPRDETESQSTQPTGDGEESVSIDTFRSVLCEPKNEGDAPRICVTPRIVPVPTREAPGATVRYYRLTVERADGASPVGYNAQADQDETEIYFWDGVVGDPKNTPENAIVNLRLPRQPTLVNIWRVNVVYGGKATILRTTYHPATKRNVALNCIVR